MASRFAIKQLSDARFQVLHRTHNQDSNGDVVATFFDVEEAKLAILLARKMAAELPQENRRNLLNAMIRAVVK